MIDTTEVMEYLKSLTVLFVEDEEDSREQYSEFLSRLVGLLVTAQNGVEGLDAWRQHKPDIIITDIRMPFMDGLSMVQKIRSVDQAIPIIILSAFDEPKYLKRSIDLGVSGFVMKPLDQDRFSQTLLKCVRELLSSASVQKIAELATQNRELSELSAASASLLSVESSDECYLAICKTAAKLFAQDLVWLGLIHEGSALIKPIAHSGITADILPDISATLNRPKNSNEPFDIAVRTGLPHLIEENDPALIEWKTNLHPYKIRSMLIVPLSVRFRCLGLLVLCSQKHDYFSPLKVSHCRIFADNAASICENTRLIEYMITSLARAAEANDEDTGNHILRLSEYCVAIAEEMKLGTSFVSRIRIHSTLHDVGKVHIPQEILKKPGTLTIEEFARMKKHPIFGVDIVGHHPMLKMSRTIAGSHHERWDGTGYPFGVKGENIPLEARIIFLADQYDALRSKRCYKPAFDHATTCRIILEGDGRTEPAHFDPLVLDAFRRCATKLDKIFEREMDNIDVTTEIDDISFTDNLWIGIPEIDEQHAELFDRIKSLNTAIKGLDIRSIGKMMDFLYAYINTHFSMEENIMLENRYPYIKEHIAQHRQYVQKLDELQKQYYQDISDQRLARYILNWLSHWLIRHIANIDRALASYLKGLQGGYL